VPNEVLSVLVLGILGFLVLGSVIYGLFAKARSGRQTIESRSGGIETLKSQPLTVRSLNGEILTRLDCGHLRRGVRFLLIVEGTYDIEYAFPFGVQELEGVAYRTDYDLTQHQTASGKLLDYFDEETKARFIPHVIEPSAGVDRTVLALICEAYDEETVTDDKGKSETRIVLRFHPRVAPIKAGVFPLLKNQAALVEKAREVQALLRPLMNVFYDETGAIGRRYRRQDEAGTPFGITIDFETLGERDPALRDTVTLRHRDSMEQERVKIEELCGRLMSAIS
jgi:glycyl-tRNA synthetase